MGTDPVLDWPHPPFRRDRKLVAVVAEHGFGTTNLNEIDFAMDGLVLPVAEFDSAQTDPPEVIDQLRRTATNRLFSIAKTATGCQTHTPVSISFYRTVK